MYRLTALDNGLKNTQSFPWPSPLSVQQEIVRILDNFTELTARKKQYEYYRDKLLTFEEKAVQE